jgi:hypothetical protein
MRPSLQMDGWGMAEMGWWVKEGVGGICREADGKWWFYAMDDSPRVGPFRTAIRAAYAANHPTTTLTHKDPHA